MQQQAFLTLLLDKFWGQTGFAANACRINTFVSILMI
jgi:hypothetical protein